jgi:hypothetical protein
MRILAGSLLLLLWASPLAADKKPAPVQAVDICRHQIPAFTVTGKQLNGRWFTDIPIRMKFAGRTTLVGAFWFPAQDIDPKDQWNPENLKNLSHVTLYFGNDPQAGDKVLHLGIVPAGQPLPESQEYRFAIEVRFARLDGKCQ